MKRLFFALSLLMLSLPLMAQENCSHFNARNTPDWFREGITYQLMPRCFTQEGTLKAAEKHLERLKELGVGVVLIIVNGLNFYLAFTCLNSLRVSMKFCYLLLRKWEKQIRKITFGVVVGKLVKVALVWN